MSALTGHRVETWEWYLLNLDGSNAGKLDGVTAARLNFSIFTTIRGGGSLEWTGRVPIDWLSYRLQPWYVAQTADGELRWPLGVFNPSAPQLGYSDTALTASVDLHDKLLDLDQHKVEASYAVPAGATVTDVVRTLLAEHGTAAVTASVETVTNPMVWEIGTSYLRIVNDLLASINYFSVWADGYGAYRAEPYIAPAYRPVDFDFADDAESIYEPDFTRELDIFEVPNRVIQVGRSDGDLPPLVGVATNSDPTSPLSINTPGPGVKGRGRVVAVAETDVEATSQAVIDGIAKRRLIELNQKSSGLTITHAQIATPVEDRLDPLGLNDAVTFVSARWGVEKLAVIQTMSMQMAPGSLVSTELLEVAL